ncbi:MAG: adenylate kinase [Bacteroidales bacterium]
MLNLALFGPPGAGKGTQSKKLIEKYNLTYIATGDLLRKEIAEGTELGLEAKALIEKGRLVPDDMIVQLIERHISTEPESKGILFDGFPRTYVQAYILEGLLMRMGSQLTAMLSLEVPRDMLVSRMLDRAQKEGRSDDTLEVIEYRLLEYETKTTPVIDFYRDKNIFYPINGVGTVDEIFERLCAAIEDALTKHWMNVVLLGAPGSGKGTQGKIIAERLGLGYISTGSLLRKEIKEGTEIGQRALPYMEKGEIVPDEIAVRLIERELLKQQQVRGFVFKGFPRTIVQAYILDGLLKKMNSGVSVAIDLKIPSLESFKRLTQRAKTDRARTYDKDPELIINRLEEYDQKTSLVKSYYKKQNKYIKVDGIGPIDVITDRLLEAINQAFRLRL